MARHSREAGAWPVAAAQLQQRTASGAYGVSSSSVDQPSKSSGKKRFAVPTKKTEMRVKMMHRHMMEKDYLLTPFVRWDRKDLQATRGKLVHAPANSLSGLPDQFAPQNMTAAAAARTGTAISILIVLPPLVDRALVLFPSCTHAFLHPAARTTCKTITLAHENNNMFTQRMRRRKWSQERVQNGTFAGKSGWKGRNEGERKFECLIDVIKRTTADHTYLFRKQIHRFRSRRRYTERRPRPLGRPLQPPPAAYKWFLWTPPLWSQPHISTSTSTYIQSLR